MPLCLTKNRVRKTLGGEEVQLHTFLTSALHGGERSASRPWRFTPRERAPGWVRWRREKSLPLPVIENRSSSPWPSHYTDWAISITNHSFIILLAADKRYGYMNGGPGHRKTSVITGRHRNEPTNMNPLNLRASDRAATGIGILTTTYSDKGVHRFITATFLIPRLVDSSVALSAMCFRFTMTYNSSSRLTTQSVIRICTSFVSTKHLTNNELITNYIRLIHQRAVAISFGAWSWTLTSV
jgi:hypothetical protein